MWVYPIYKNISSLLVSFSLSGVLEGTFQPDQSGVCLGVTLPLLKSLTAGTEAVSHNWVMSFWNLPNRVSSRKMKFTAGQWHRHGTSLVKALWFYQSSTGQWMAWAERILLGLDIPFYHSHSPCNLMPGQFSRTENVYFLSLLATMSSVSTCGTEELFSAGLDVPKICSTYFPRSHMQFLLPFYWSEQDCDPGHSSECLCETSGATETLRVGGGSPEGCLKRGPHSDKGADLKYRCEMVCGVQGKSCMAVLSRVWNPVIWKQEVGEKRNMEFNSERYSGEHKVSNWLV